VKRDLAGEGADADRKRFDKRSGRDTPVPGQHDGDVVSEPRERWWKRPEDVGETAGLREWMRLGSDQQN
jgi:hypothetical protein